MSGRILIVDDEKDMLSLLKRIISEETDHEIEMSSDPVRALELVQEQAFDLIFTDLKMPGMDGIQLLEGVKKIRPDATIVVLTAYATIDTAVDAIRKGAYDYITKPFDRERIIETIDKVMEWHAGFRDDGEGQRSMSRMSQSTGLIGATSQMDKIFEQIKQVAPTMGTVLITGPSGTGKELVAKAIHQNSLRQNKKLVTLNCTAIPEQVLESELFGHVKGAFTGAVRDKKGLVEEANEGSLFFDEIGDLSLVMQIKLLRLLQEGEYKPVGSVVTNKADLRFIAATHHDLKADIKERQFREDLYYRLNVINFNLPALKERQADIPLLADYFLKKYSTFYQKDIKEISPEALQALLHHELPGNVRELENIIERGVIFCSSGSLELYDLYLDDEQGQFIAELNEGISEMPFKEARDKMIHMFHKLYIPKLLKECHGNISRAAEVAGIKRQYLHRLIKENGIEIEVIKNSSD